MDILFVDLRISPETALLVVYKFIFTKNTCAIIIDVWFIGVYVTAVEEVEISIIQGAVSYTHLDVYKRQVYYFGQPHVQNVP